MKRFSSALLCVAMVAVTSVQAFAGWLPDRKGGLGGSSTTITPTSGRIDGQLTFTDLTISSKTGDFAGLGLSNWSVGFKNFDSVADGNLGDTYTFSDAALGTFVGTIQVVTPTGDLTAASGLPSAGRSFDLVGTFTPGSDSHFDNGRETLNNVFFNVNFTRDGGGTVNFSWSMTTTASAPVPEPTSIAIFTLGAAGFAVRRFRRK